MALILRGKVWYDNYYVKVVDSKTGKTIFKRKQKALSVNRRTAEQMQAQRILEQCEEKYDGKPSNISWQTFKTRFLAFSKGKKTKNTHGTDRRAIAKLEEVFPIQKLSDVRPQILEEAMNKWKESGRELHTINRHRSAIVAMMHKAEEWEYIKAQRWGKVQLYKVTEARTEYYTLEELSKIFKTLKGDYRTTAYIQSLAGLRISEAIHLEWSDIDFKRNRINISAKPGWEPKTHEKRSIPLVPDLKAYLESLPRLSNRVLAQRKWSMGSFSHMVARALENAGFQGSSHKFRHSYGSLNIMAGVPMKTVSIWMGHASVETTEKHYAHLGQDHMDLEAKKFPSLGSVGTTLVL